MPSGQQPTTAAEVNAAFLDRTVQEARPLVTFNRYARPTPADPLGLQPVEGPQGEPLPQEVYITYDQDYGHELSAYRDLEKFREDRRVGVYKLVEIKHLKIKRELV